MRDGIRPAAPYGSHDKWLSDARISSATRRPARAGDSRARQMQLWAALALTIRQRPKGFLAIALVKQVFDEKGAARSTAVAVRSTQAGKSEPSRLGGTTRQLRVWRITRVDPAAAS